MSSLAEGIAIVAGIGFEIMLLWDSAQRREGKTRPSPFQSLPLGSLIPGSVSGMQVYMFLFLVVSWALIGIASLFKIEHSPFGIFETISNILMTAWFFFLFVFGLVWPRLMPRINEQTILVTNLVILPGFLAQQGRDLWPAALVLLPSLAMLLLIVFPRKLHPVLKALSYLWYLACLLIATVQSNFEVLYASSALNTIDSFILGQASTFMLLNALFLVRFFLMLAALVLPANRRYIDQTMPQLFNDEQVSPLRFGVLLAIGVLIIAIDVFTDLAAPVTLTNLLILLAVHGMERPFGDTKVYWASPK